MPGQERPIARRPHLDPTEVLELRSVGLLATDTRRSRPLWFDGRFLAARDLEREQIYLMTRQADLARTSGSGVSAGLQVRVDPESPATTLLVQPGVGVTPSGDVVVLDTVLRADLSDRVLAQRLEQAFGQSAKARTRLGGGLFVLALRPVEFTTGTAAAYPTQPEGFAGQHPAELVEGTLLTLLPFGSGGVGDLDAARRKAARDIFLQGADRHPGPDALPLAMVALDRSGFIYWIDNHLLRRELAVDPGDLFGLGLAPRASRRALVMHHESRLRDLLARATAPFPAMDHFSVLPPVGRFPELCLDRQSFTQVFFPPGVDVELGFVPTDELPAVVEEALMLPPIDLEAGPEALDNVGIQILVPVPRDRISELQRTLAQLSRPLRAPARPNARRLPAEALRRLALTTVQSTPTSSQAPLDRAWAEALQLADPSVSDGTWWYARHRSVHLRAGLVGASVPVDRATNDT